MATTDFDAAAVAALSFQETYNNEELFRWLMHSIGINTVTSRDKIVQDGFNSIQSLVHMHSNDTDGFKKYLSNLNKTFATAAARIRVYYSPVVITRFAAVLFYYDQCINGYHTIPDLSLIDSAFADDMIQALKDKEEAKENDSDDGEDIKIPNLKGSDDWIDFRDAFVLKLGETVSKRGFPLDYIIDDTPRTVTSSRAALIEAERVEVEDVDYYRTHAVLFGPQFKADNKSLWTKLKKLLLGTDCYNHISDFSDKKDGRGAWQALTSVFEGPNFKARLRELAFTRLNNTFYKGETANFNFEKYVTIHKKAHTMLQQADYNNGKGMDEETKIQHFKSGIKADAGIEYCLTQMRAQPASYATFTQVTNYLTGEIDHKQLRKAQLKTTTPGRVVAKVGKETTFKMVDGKKVFAKRYSRNEFHALTKAQRNAVIEMQREKRNKGGPNRGYGRDRGRGRGQGNGGGNNANNASSLKRIPNEDLTVIAEAVIAGVSKATADNEGLSVITEASNTEKKKDLAEAGSVGDFIAKHRQNKRQKK